MVVGCNKTKDTAQEQEKENITKEQEQQLLLNGVSLTKDIIRSVYRGNDKYTYEVLLFSLAKNDDENNLYKEYFSFDENKGHIFPLDKSNEVLLQVFGEKEYRPFEEFLTYDEESAIYYRNLDFGWTTGYIAENVTADISDDKLKLYTNFELIDLWYNVGRDPIATAVADCEMAFSVNKSNDKIYLQFENIEVVSKVEESITNSNLDEALSKVQDEVKILTGLDNIEASELFSIDNTYYIKVKPKGLSELWRYENGDLKRIIYNVKDVAYNQDDEKIIIDGANNSYIIKYKNDNEGKGKILYECYYTDILHSDNGDFTCYINDFFSVCVVDNISNEIILNKYLDEYNEFSNEDFILDNSRFFLPTRMQINETGWIKNSNMVYFASYDMSHIFFVIDIDKKIVSQPNFTTGMGYESFIDKDNGYIVSGKTYYALDTDSYMMNHLEKQYNYLYLTNLYTLEKFEISKSIRTKFECIKEDEKTIRYIASSGEWVTVDISDMIGKESTYIRAGFKDTLYSQLSLDEADNVNLYKFNDIVYAVVDKVENKMLIQFTEGNKVNIIEDNIDDVNFSELGKYISLYNKNGNLIILDKSGNKYFEDNVFNYISNNDTGSKNQDGENNTELGVTLWGKNNDKLYILTKNGDRLGNIFEVNFGDKSIRDLAYDIDCRYENLYIDLSKEFVVYSTFPGPIFYSYDKDVNDDVYLYVKYFNSGEKVEIARAKGESIHFYIFDNELNYNCIENNDIQGVYKLVD